jgi:hypothetical protein
MASGSNPSETSLRNQLLSILEDKAGEFSREIKETQSLEIKVTKARFDRPDIELRWHFGTADCNLHVEIRTRGVGHEDLRLSGAAWWDSPGVKRVVRRIEPFWFNYSGPNRACQLRQRLHQAFSQVCDLATKGGLSRSAHSS